MLVTEISVKTLMARIMNIMERSFFSILNLTWKRNVVQVHSFWFRGRDPVLGEIAQNHILAICLKK